MMMVLLLIDRSIYVEESHYVGHMQTEYTIGDHQHGNNRGDISICATSWLHSDPMQSRYKKQLAFNVVEL